MLNKTELVESCNLDSTTDLTSKDDSTVVIPRHLRFKGQKLMRYLHSEVNNKSHPLLVIT